MRSERRKWIFKKKKLFFAIFKCECNKTNATKIEFNLHFRKDKKQQKKIKELQKKELKLRLKTK